MILTYPVKIAEICCKKKKYFKKIKSKWECACEEGIIRLWKSVHFLLGWACDFHPGLSSEIIISASACSFWSSARAERRYGRRQPITSWKQLQCHRSRLTWYRLEKRVSNVWSFEKNGGYRYEDVLSFELFFSDCDAR